MNKIIFLLICLACSTNIQALVVGTYLLPPFSMHEDGEDIGLTTEIIQEVLKKSGNSDIKILTYPVARGLAELNAGRIDVFYPYVKLESNPDPAYILLGPIAKYQLALFVAATYNGKIDTSALHDKVIGIESGSIAESLLANSKLHLEHVSQQVNCLKMVLASRISACALGILPGIYISTMNDLNQKLHYAQIGEYAEMYMLLRKDLPQKVVDDITVAFKELQKQGFFGARQLEYEKRFKLFEKTMS